jgi:hypothetical protein
MKKTASFKTRHMPDGNITPLRFDPWGFDASAIEALEHDLVESLPAFKRRLN